LDTPSYKRKVHSSAPIYILILVTQDKLLLIHMQSVERTR